MPHMVVTLDVSKLSGWLNLLGPSTCRVEREACDAKRGAAREAGGRGAAAAKMTCTRRARLKAWGQGTRGAHAEHGVHARNFRRVEAQRLVESRRALPSRKQGIRDVGRGARVEGGEGAWGAGGGESGMHGEGPTQGWGSRARAERTPNMEVMSVTLDVSQLEMSALKFTLLRKRLFMSVMVETHQSAMGPYELMGPFELNIFAAAFREALSVKVLGDGGLSDGGGGLGDGGGGEGDGGGGDGNGGGGDGDCGGGLGEGGGGE
eukprot:scaffold124174_cov48-Phaeocystis_antarctica.AAC.4